MLISSVVLLAGANPLDVTLGTSLGVMTLATVLGFVQTARMRERVFLADLGVPLPAITPFLLAPAVVGEMLRGTRSGEGGGTDGCGVVAGSQAVDTLWR